MLWTNVILSCRAKPGGVHAGSSGSLKTGAAPEPEDLIAPGTPIQFDIMLPASEFQDQNRAGGRWVSDWGGKLVWGCRLVNNRDEPLGGDDANFQKFGPIVVIRLFSRKLNYS